MKKGNNKPKMEIKTDKKLNNIKSIKITYSNVNNETYKTLFTVKFNELLEQYLKEGHQQREITENTGISPASITQYKNGTSVPKGDILERLANYFNVSPNYLLGKSETPSYTFDDINKKIGLSQKSIETLYNLQHNTIDENIDITEEKEISEEYRTQLNILNLFFEDSEKLLTLLNDIKTYKENYNKTKDSEKLDFYEYRLTKDFMKFIQELVKGK